MLAPAPEQRMYLVESITDMAASQLILECVYSYIYLSIYKYVYIATYEGEKRPFLKGLERHLSALSLKRLIFF